ncbi:MFS transporter [Spiribacter sp. C176]|uniref:MFS transporter n=1 Tax=Spiribacter salilacus TaxID=2664894 RepID=A0A6N7QNV3_9GAMM|nr:MFS transporter [Spiribacter salilacus]MRH77360.1 MFS transporter [Spiribacter salilacus]
MLSNRTAQPSLPLALILLWAAGLYLRLTVMVAPPLAPIIADELQLSQTGLGALTTVPILMLAIASLGAAWVISRIGARQTLIIALLGVVLMSSLRSFASAATLLFIASALMGLAIAAMQPALPTLLGAWWPSRLALGTAVYMNGMLMGEVVGSTLTLPLIMPLVGNDWRAAIIFWSLPGLIPALGILLLTRGRGVATNAPGSSARWMPDWRHPLVWRLGGLLGASGCLFFGTNAYLGAVLQGRDESHLIAIGLILLNGSQLIASVLMFWFSRYWLGRAKPLITLLSVGLIGLIWFIFLPGWLGLAALGPAGVAAGMVLILLMGLPPVYRQGMATAGLAAGMFTIGSIVNFVVPLFGGFLADLTGQLNWVLLPIAAYVLISLPLARGLPDPQASILTPSQQSSE